MQETHCAPADSRKPVAVVAIGNTLRSDDGVAQVLLSMLPSDLKQRVAIADLGIHSSFISDFISDFGIAVIIDASLPAGCPGKVSIVELDLESRTLATATDGPSPVVKSTHGLCLSDEIAISRLAKQSEVYPRVFLFSVEVFDTTFGSAVSEVIAASLPEISSKLAQLLYSLLALGADDQGCVASSVYQRTSSSVVSSKSQEVCEEHA